MPCLILVFYLFVCVVNFRGSTGYGDDSIRSLLNNVGDNDVKDVQVDNASISSL